MTQRPAMLRVNRRIPCPPTRNSSRGHDQIFIWGKQCRKVISAQGLVYAAVIDATIAEHNQDPDEVIHFSDHETAFMRLFPFLLPKTNHS